MKNIQIIYNPVLEFFCSIGRIVFNKEIKARFDIFDFDKNIQEYVDTVNSNMSSLMKNDMNMLTKKIAGGLVVPIYFCLSNGITELSDFFHKFGNLTGEEYFNMYMKVFEIDDIRDDEPSIITQILKEKLNWYFPSEDDIFFLEFKKYPDEMKNRLDTLFKLYYEKFYRQIEEKPLIFMRGKVGDYKRQYEVDGDEFLSDLLALDMNKLKSLKKQIILYPSYFYEVGVTEHLTEDSICILFGYVLEQRVNIDFRKKRAMEVLKILSDEKRYEMLKLLGQKSYFGAQLSEAVNLTKSTVSYHINKMLTLGLLNLYVGENNRSYLSLNKKALKDILSYIYQDLANYEDREKNKV